MLEKYAIYLLGFAALLAVSGYLWLVVRAFRVHLIWGLAALLFPPSLLLFCVLHFSRAKWPLGVMLLACLTFAAPYGLSYYQRHFMPLGPHERIVDGELRLTLTGLEGFDYASLQAKRDLAVLQMANAEVGDDTLKYLRGMDKLYSLDLNDTGVTDAGMATLADLPSLRELRLARTEITDEGFKAHLAQKESLLKLDLTGTPVTGKTKRAWKNARPNDREYVD
jgi:hypothetical protein